MMSGLDGCLRTDVTWVGSGKKEERVFMSAFLLPNAGWGQQPNRVRHGRLVVLYVASVSDVMLDIVPITAIAAKDLPSAIVQRSPSYVYDVADPSVAHRICPDTWLTAKNC